MADDQPDGVSVPTLVMTGGPLDGTAYPLPLTGREAVVGSSMDADVQIMLGNVEPFHARVVFVPAGLAIEDAGSATGTFVNGERVERAHVLQDGDRICLGPPGAKGSAKLLVRLPGGRPDAPPSLAAGSAAPALIGGAEAAPALRDETPLLSLEGEEAGPAREQAEPLFTRPLPPPPVAPPPVAPPPPPPERLTAPPPPPPPPAPPPPADARPEYQTDLPSIPVDREEAPASSEFPPLRPAPKAAAPSAGKGKGRPAARRRRSLSIPVLPLLGGAAGLAAVAGIVWLFFLRGTPAELASVTPAVAEPGKPVTLAGRHFAADAAGNTVLFGQARGQVTAAGATELTVVVPAGVKGQVPVVVQTRGGRSQAVTVTVQAVAKAVGLEPDVAMPGQTVLVRGEGFEGQKLAAEVGGVAAPAVEATAEGARVTIPTVPLPEGSKTSLVLKVGTTPPRTFDLWLGRLPFVADVSPRRGAVGDRVVLRGRGFRPDPLGNSVTFGGEAALVITASEHELSVIAPAPPAGDIQPELPVVVTVAGHASAGTSTYAVVRGATAGFVPRFFAAPVTEFPGEGLVFVSTELGPVLLFGGPAGSPSTAERAVKVSAALNALVAGAANRPPAFEPRQSPQPSVGVVGEVSPFLVPTPEDAAAYSRNWETGRGAGRRVAPAALARHWAALLQDYFGLFLYRQRPLQMAALSPRGRVLTEIYGEANRRSPGGRTVPTSLVLPTSAGMATALRQMALVVSGEGGGRAAVAVEGRWDGTIEDPDLGTRRFDLLVRNEGGRLAGTLTTWRGKIELKSPVRDIGFDRGNVRFTADLQGTAYRFRGVLDNNAVEGTIERAGKPPARFTLRFVE